MVILDTDHLSILDQDTIEGFTLGRHLAALPEVLEKCLSQSPIPRGNLTDRTPARGGTVWTIERFLPSNPANVVASPA